MMTAALPAPRRFPAPAFATALAVLAALAAAGCGQQDLYAPPGAPFARIGTLPLPSMAEGVAVLGDQAFVAAGEAGLHCVSLADPAHPVLLSTTNTTKYAGAVEVLRTFARNRLVDVAFVVEGTEGITTYDVTDPAAVASFGQGTTATDGSSLFIMEAADFDAPAIVYLAENWKGVRVFATDPDQPGALAYNGVFAGTQGYAKAVAVRDGWAYVADDEMGLAVLDARQLILGQVRLVSWCDSPGNALDVVLDGDYAYVADGTEGLAVFRIDAGQTPVCVAQFDLPGFSRAVAVRDGLAVVAAATAGVQFLDVSEPAAPAFLGAVPTGYASDVVLAGSGLVLVSDRSEGLIVLGGRGPFRDLTPPAPALGLTAAPLGATRVELSWYAPGDDRLTGAAARCEVRRAAAPIVDEASWAAATEVADPPPPGVPGTRQTFVVSGLEPATTYHFAVRAWDEAGNPSPLPADAVATTLSGTTLRDAALDRVAGTLADLFTWTVVYENSYAVAPESAVVVVDGGARELPLSLVSGDYVDGALFRAQATLPRGAHGWLCRFTAPGGERTETPPAAGPVVGAVVFTMGSPPSEPGRDADEAAHVVVLSDSVVVAAHEVTQAEWTATGLANPSRFVDPARPVERVTWFDAVEYCNRRSLADALTPAYTITAAGADWDRNADGWRLPTEAEWEWACRGGSASSVPGGDLTETQCGLDPLLDVVGWYCGNAGAGTHPVGGKAPGPRGLYDMHGNVWEWCWDWYGDYEPGPLLDPVGPADGFRRVRRGGSWYYYARDCRAASRDAYWPTSADDVVGLRPVRTARAR